MNEIDYGLLCKIKEDKKNKHVECSECLGLFEQCKLICGNIGELLNQLKAHELAQWIVAEDFYIRNKKAENHFHYPSRSILYVELGNNIGDELSYEHLAVLIKESGDKLFVIPCSSSNRAHYKLENYNKEYMLAKEEDGFPKETVLFIKESKWVSKSRVVSTYKNRVDGEFFKEIKTRLLTDLFNQEYEQMQSANKKIELHKRNEDMLKTENLGLRGEITLLTETIAKLNKDNDNLYELLDINTSDIKAKENG